MSFPPVAAIVFPSASPYIQQRENRTTDAPVTQDLIFDLDCRLEIIGGYNGDPVSTNLLYLQLHDSNAAIAPGHAPVVVLPVYGGSVYSYGIEQHFANGLVVALSTTEYTFTAPAADYLNYAAVVRTR